MSRSSKDELPGKDHIPDSIDEPSFQDIFENVVVGIFQTTKDGHYIRVNTRLAELYGYNSPEELIELIGDIGHQLYVDPSRRGEFMRLVQSKSTVDQFESEIYRKDGSRIWISESARGVKDTAGRFRYYEGTVQDVTDKKRAEAALHHSEILYHSLVENLPQNIFRKDATGRFTFANTRFCKLLDRPLHEILGKTDHDFFPLKLASKYQADDREIMESGITLDTVEENKTPGGEKTFVHVVKTRMRDESGHCVGVQGIFWDVTQQKHTELLLAHERDLLRALLDNIPDRIYFKDRESRFLRISRALSAEFGLQDPGEAVGKTDRNFFSNEYAGITLEDERRILETGRAIIGKTEKEMLQDGQVNWVLTTKMPLRNPDGEVIGTFGVSKDITQLKETEAELAKARDAALELARIKSEFLANTSHEVRTPLNAILGMTGLLRDTPLTPQQEDFLQTIRTSADGLLEVINDILDYSKIEAKKLLVESISFDLREVVESAVDLLAGEAQGKQLELGCLIDQDVPCALVGDPGRLRQVLTNLLSNAVKFTKEGEILVRVTLVRDSRSQVELRCEIQDTGIGIPAEVEKKLFQPFTQADGSLTRRYGGTGLGLAISKQLVEMMGGRIEFSSEEGKGSTFRFELPLDKQTNVQTSEIQQEGLVGMRALIVDDHSTHREILQHTLRAWGMQTREAKDGKDALNQLRKAADKNEPYQAVILNFQLPDMDGLALAHTVKVDLRMDEVKLIMLTPLGLKVYEGKWKDAGIDSYLSKPVKQSRLLPCLLQVLDAEHAEAKPRSDEPIGHRIRIKTKPLRILIAEDNRVNQKVTLLQLEKLGFIADAVGNGVEAVEAIRKIPYDAILMDCQMPEMDGFKATRTIRKLTSIVSVNPVRIIALTANANPEERRKCLEAGMDDFLSKPIEIDQLEQALRETAKTIGTDMPDRTDTAPNGNPGGQPILAGLRAIGDASIITELIELFLEDAPRRTGQIRAALKSSNSSSLAEAAHSLKGSAQNLGATALGIACEAVEKESKSGSLANAYQLVEKLEAELNHLCRLLEGEKSDSGN